MGDFQQSSKNSLNGTFCKQFLRIEMRLINVVKKLQEKQQLVSKACKTFVSVFQIDCNVSNLKNLKENY